MSSALSRLLDTFDLAGTGPDRFAGRSLDDGWRRIYGGQVIAQALIAAARTCDGRPPHSLHGYFLQPGDPRLPISYEVVRLRDGRSFLARQVHAVQDEQVIFSMMASFHGAEDGHAHQAAMPDAPPPESLLSPRDVAALPPEVVPPGFAAFAGRPWPIEIRACDLSHFIPGTVLPPRQLLWIRPDGPVPEDALMRAALLAYASDMSLLDTALFPHGTSFLDPLLQMASIDHAVWFHQPVDWTDWMLYACDSPFAGGARGFSRGAVYRRDGTLVASTAQEGLIRKRAQRQVPVI